MKRYIEINRKYLLIPVCAEKEVKTVSVLCRNEKIFEFAVPMHDRESGFYSFHYFAPVNVEKYQGKTFLIEGEIPRSFLDAVSLCDSIPENTQPHPLIHFAPDTGWMNDPNGLIYQDGIYHMYFQQNPFDTRWENMCWGHAVSRDLLHWEQKETALYPDSDGVVYSGSGIVNEHGMLGLPKDAHIFFYTCAGNKSKWSLGKTFNQRIAYSTDGGKNILKLEGSVVKHISEENRDPKVYWHEGSKAYYMVLYLKANDFMILRSRDLKSWKKTQVLTLDQASECPDLREVPVEGGGSKWMFWTADGFYFLGDFDGYEFKSDGVRHEAYLTGIPYAAQTIWGTEDIITIPWLRTKNKGKMYTGVMGLPRKLTLAQTPEGLKLRQVPVREFQKARVSVSASQGEGKVFYMAQKPGAVEICIHMQKPGDFVANIYGTSVTYVASCGKMNVGKESVQIGKELNDFSIIADGEIVEVTAQNGLIYAVFELDTDRKAGNVTVDIAGKAYVDIYRIE